MTLPRMVLPGTTYLVTRRCTQRQFLLRPCAYTDHLVSYLMAVAAERTGVELHAFVVMSNHLHLVLTDPQARLPVFEQLMNEFIARKLNGFLARCENFWKPCSYNAVTLLGPEDVLDKTAYTLANPVAAGLVPRGRDWPGLWSDPAGVGGPAVPIPRPPGFGRRFPAVAWLRLTCPPGFASPAAFRAALTPYLEHHERRARLAMRLERRRFLGALRVLLQDPFDSPSTCENGPSVRPRIASFDVERRVEMLERLDAFQFSYRIAWLLLVAGVRTVVFPAGTYLQRVTYGLACEPPS